ncbi:MAG: hypothetical protein Gaeavirus15_8 [Gaeavirus sp.]|uniref:Uncharacterized protein n=1 Tax=Gaeavirus sp. TaxID=2487767 RepID=A0A3G4ZZ62_9VIRU|nr:MAG: hypothetical protein Gaeavirus15_8 [Gaeavirus sp.]
MDYYSYPSGYQHHMDTDKAMERLNLAAGIIYQSFRETFFTEYGFVLLAMLVFGTYEIYKLNFILDEFVKIRQLIKELREHVYRNDTSEESSFEEITPPSPSPSPNPRNRMHNKRHSSSDTESKLEELSPKTETIFEPRDNSLKQKLQYQFINSLKDDDSHTNTTTKSDSTEEYDNSDNDNTSNDTNELLKMIDANSTNRLGQNPSLSTDSEFENEDKAPTPNSNSNSNPKFKDQEPKLIKRSPKTNTISEELESFLEPTQTTQPTKSFTKESVDTEVFKPKKTSKSKKQVEPEPESEPEPEPENKPRKSRRHAESKLELESEPEPRKSRRHVDPKLELESESEPEDKPKKSKKKTTKIFLEVEPEPESEIKPKTRGRKSKLEKARILLEATTQHENIKPSKNARLLTSEFNPIIHAT